MISGDFIRVLAGFFAVLAVMFIISYAIDASEPKVNAEEYKKNFLECMKVVPKTDEYPNSTCRQFAERVSGVE
jgi:hypothetical protein